MSVIANIPALIAEARGFAAGSESARATLMRDLADALEATVREMHAPKDDEWEALTLIVRDVHNYDGRPEFLSLHGKDAGRIAAAILAAGFRRSVSQEPSARELIDAIYDAEEDDLDDLDDSVRYGFILEQAERLRVPLVAPERCRVDGGDNVRVEMADLRRAYDSWCKEQHETPVSSPLCLKPHPITGARCSKPAEPRHGHVCSLPPQGEPSDAQVHAAAVAIDPAAWEPGIFYQEAAGARDNSLDLARAALRAAAAVREQAPNRTDRSAD